MRSGTARSRGPLARIQFRLSAPTRSPAMRPVLFFVAGLAAVLPASAQPPAVIPVALYVDAGVSGKGPDMFEATAKTSPDLTVTRLKAADVRAGRLKGFRVLVMPGGSG